MVCVSALPMCHLFSWCGAWQGYLAGVTRHSQGTKQCVWRKASDDRAHLLVRVACRSKVAASGMRCLQGKKRLSRVRGKSCTCQGCCAADDVALTRLKKFYLWLSIIDFSLTSSAPHATIFLVCASFPRSGHTLEVVGRQAIVFGGCADNDNAPGSFARRLSCVK